MKPDYLVRVMLIVLVVLLAAQVGFQVFQQTGRYAVMAHDASGLALLDTRTGSVYVFAYQTKQTVKVDVVEQSKNKSLMK